MTRAAACRLTALALACALHAATPAAWGSGVREADDGWLLAPAQAAALLDGHQLGAPGSGSWCAVSSGRLYGLDDLPLVAVDCRVHLVGEWALGAAWRRVGGDLYRWDGVDLRVGRTGRWRVALRGRQEAQRLGGWDAPPRAAMDLVAGTTVAAGNGVPIHLDAHLPLAPWPVADTRRVDPVARLATCVGAMGLAVAWDRRGDGTPLLGAEAMFLLSGGAAVLIRTDGNSGSFGPGLAVGRGNLLIRTSHLVHPVLGVTHRVQVAVAGRADPHRASR